MKQLSNEKQLTVSSTSRRMKPWQERFLRSLRVSPDISVAASKARVTRQHCYRAREADPVFRVKWQEAIDASVDALEAKAFALAKAGDGQLLSWLLKCHRGSTYNTPSRSEVAVAGGIVLLPMKELQDE